MLAKCDDRKIPLSPPLKKGEVVRGGGRENMHHLYLMGHFITGATRVIAGNMKSKSQPMSACVTVVW